MSASFVTLPTCFKWHPSRSYFSDFQTSVEKIKDHKSTEKRSWKSLFHPILLHRACDASSSGVPLNLQNCRSHCRVCTPQCETLFQDSNCQSNARLFFFFFFQDSNCHSGRTSSLVLMTGAAISGQDLSLFYGRDETFLDVIEMYSNRPVARYLRLLLRLRLCSLFSIYRGDNRQGYNRGKRKRSITSKSLHSRFWTHSSATMCWLGTQLCDYVLIHTSGHTALRLGWFTLLDTQLCDYVLTYIPRHIALWLYLKRVVK